MLLSPAQSGAKFAGFLLPQPNDTLSAVDLEPTQRPNSIDDHCEAESGY